MTRQPVARLIADEGCRRIWSVKWPSTVRKDGKAYTAITYPDSALITIETAAKRRPVSALVGNRIVPAIESAIRAAEVRSREQPAD